MSNSRAILVENKAVLEEDSGGCLCGRCESCEICDSSSQYNRLRSNLLRLINGPTAPCTIKDYAAVVTVDRSELIDDKHKLDFSSVDMECGLKNLIPDESVRLVSEAQGRRYRVIFQEEGRYPCMSLKTMGPLGDSEE